MALNDLRKGRYSSIGQDYFVTFTTHRRICYLQNFSYANVVARNIHYRNSIQTLAWVIMPDHVHILFTLLDGNLSNNVAAIKACSSREIRIANKHFKWADGFYDHALRKEENRITIARYIVANPLRAKLATSLSRYSWWDSAYL